MYMYTRHNLQTAIKLLQHSNVIAWHGINCQSYDVTDMGGVMTSVSIDLPRSLHSPHGEGITESLVGHVTTAGRGFDDVNIVTT